jgi:hypothetical protein
MFNFSEEKIYVNVIKQINLFQNWQQEFLFNEKKY